MCLLISGREVGVLRGEQNRENKKKRESGWVDDDGYKGGCQCSFSSATSENPSGDRGSCLRLSSRQKARQNFPSAISRLLLFSIPLLLKKEKKRRKKALNALKKCSSSKEKGYKHSNHIENIFLGLCCKSVVNL